MERIINKVKLFANDNKKSKEIERYVRKVLLRNNFKIVDKNYDLAIAIGGDGSFLRILKYNNFNSNVFYIGINAGTLGFLQEIKPNEIKEFVYKLNHNAFKIEEVSIQESIISSDEANSIFYSLNEIVIRDLELNTIKMDIEIDNEKLESFVGDGLLISTSVGSTAYNLSFGGSIVYNNFHTLQITPIAPLNNKSYRNLTNSVIIPENLTITLYPKDKSADLIVTVDGENKKYNNVRRIETLVRDKKIKCIRMQNYNYTKIINEKFLA